MAIDNNKVAINALPLHLDVCIGDGDSARPILEPCDSLGIRSPSAAPMPSVSVRCAAGGESTATPAALDPDFDKKAFRHNLTRSDNYNRKGFGHKKETMELMSQEYTSDVIKTLKENGNEYTWGNVTVKLAEAYGFCWGVKQAVQIAYEARKQFPEEKIWITNEIIHNPTVNKRLKEMAVKNIPIEDGQKQFDVVDESGVVVLPAFESKESTNSRHNMSMGIKGLEHH